MKTIAQVLIVTPALLFMFISLLLLDCNFYNPFEDFSNAKAIINSSINEGDTVEIFQTESITVDLTVRELISTLSFECKGNRFTTDSSIQISGIDSVANSFKFKCSFYDTGKHLIQIRVTRLNGEDAVYEIPVFVKNPLVQKPITGFIGEQVMLSSDGVKDKDVFYHWDFGNGIQIRSQGANYGARIYGDLINLNTGLFWVSDLPELHSSPQIRFTFLLKDTVGPEITCMGCNGDTVVATGSIFRFFLSISDDGMMFPVYATVNGSLLNCKDELLYYSDLYGVDTITKPKALYVIAKDNSGNVTNKTFWLTYNPSMPYNELPELIISTPFQDRLIVNRDSIEVAGSFAWNSTYDKYSVVIYSDQTAVDTCGDLGKSNGHWGTVVPLHSGINLIKMAVLDSTGKELTSVERVVVHEKQDGEDTSEPRIVDVTVNNISVKYSLIIDDFNPTINVIAFDESRIKSVKIDTFYAVVKNGYSWESKVPISHFGTQIRIVVTDESNNSSRYSINLRQNYAPSIIGDKILFDSCFVGDTIRGSVNATDSNPSDLPLLRYSSSTPGVMIDSISGKYMWVASTERTQNELQFKVSDAVNSTEFKRFIYVLKDSTPKPSSIRFLTTADDFPSILIAGRDTLKGDVMITGGNNPVMSVYKPKNTSNIPVVTGSKLQWLPQEEDTGMQKITLVASDSSGDSAFFNLSITVLSQKDTFATSSNWLGLTNPDKSLNLSSSENSNILTVRIIGYSGDYSGFDVQYFLLGKVYHDSIVNSVCQIALDPNAKAYGRDSIVVIVTHKGAISRRLVKQLDYGNPPDIPLITSPLSYSTVAEDSFTVKWQCSDPDNNPLSYTIYIAAENDIFKPLGTTNKTSFICSGLVKAGKSYLRVVASDGKTSTESELVVINLLPPNRVMIKNTASEIPKYIEVDSTWTLPLKTSNGIPPFVFTVVSNAAVKPYIDSLNNLDWTPSVADTGKKSLKVKLVDSIGNCDSIDAQVWILSKRCSPQLTWSSTNSINGGLDLHTTSVPETLYFNIEDDDPTEIESYSIKTKINHIEGVQSLLSKKTFKVIVFPVQSNSSTDTITVTVTDMWGLQDSVLIPVFYGNAPYNPLPLTPAINEEISGGTVNFSWDCEDPDGDKLNYTLYMGKEPDSLITGIVTDKKSMQITGLTPSEYYFKIIATDGLHSTESSVIRFFVK